MNRDLKILILRRDRLGDVLMTLPSLVYLRGLFPEAKLDFYCQNNLHELLKGFCDEVRVELVQNCEKKYDGVLFLNGELSDAWKIFKSKIAIRVGLYSKPTSFLFLNGGLRQKRSSSGKNEAESNLELAQVLATRLGIDQKFSKTESVLPVNEKARTKAVELFSELGISKESPIAIFHPGMRGSALNITAQSYLRLIEEFENRGYQIVLSQGPEKQDLHLKVQILQERPNLHVLSGLNLAELAECFRLAKWVVAPSTGPLHLAHWVGVSTLGIYSPVKAQHPVRWAPWGGKKPSKILMPQVTCPAETECLGASCEFFNCMDKLKWKDLLLPLENV
jgi:ADP-heptose:LPS heptosyltransferase